MLAALAAGTAARAEPAALSNAADPARKAPPINYQSPFVGYLSFQVPPRQPWADANEQARAIGGQTGVLQDESEPVAPKPTAGGKP